MSTKEILPPLLYVVKYMENEDFYADPAFKSDINVFFTGANDRKEVDLRKNDNTTYFRYEGPVITKVTVFGTPICLKLAFEKSNNFFLF
jgi:hypothetical protein